MAPRRMNEEQDEQAQDAALEAQAEAERHAAAKRARKAPSEARESDFIEGADLSGPHQPRKGWTFVEKINETVWRLAPLDGGTVKASDKVAKAAEEVRQELDFEGMKLQARAKVARKAFVAALEAEAAGEEPETPSSELEAEMRALYKSVSANQEALAETLTAQVAAARVIVEFCLRDWVRTDGIGLNATSRAALDASRVVELATCCADRYATGQNNARFRQGASAS